MMLPTVHHGVLRVPQPSPGIHDGGDCFACASLAIVRHFYPDCALTVAEMVDLWKTTSRDGTPVLSNHFGYGRDALMKLYDTYPVTVEADPFLLGWNEFGSDPPSAWYNPLGSRVGQRIHAYLSAGWIGLANIRHSPAQRGLGDPIPDRPGRRYLVSMDHFVVVDGFREYWLNRTGHTDLRVVCSVSGDYWIDLGDLCEFHGFGQVWWVRARHEAERFEGDGPERRHYG